MKAISQASADMHRPGTLVNPTNITGSLDELSAAGRDWRTLRPHRQRHPDILMPSDHDTQPSIQKQFIDQVTCLSSDIK
jgi:hypothetical protein